MEKNGYISMKLIFNALVKKCNQWYKKVKEIFKSKKDLMTCSNSKIDKLGRCHALSDNVQTTNIEQALLLLCFVLHMSNNIKFNLYYN